MWGSVIGDLAGSIYEFSQVKGISPVVVKDIIPSNAFYSDDTILTIAVMDAILNDGDYEKYIREYGKNYINYRPDVSSYFKTSFSPGFIKWLNSDGVGFSTGNGAMMRIAPVGFLFNDLDTVREESVKAVSCSHNSSEAINCSKIISSIIYLARCGHSKEEIIDLLDLDIKYVPFSKFNTTCNDTIGNCLYALFTSSSYDEAIRKVISFGGDTDTNACIVGGMAEALFGLDNKLIEEAKGKIPKEFVKVLELGYMSR